MRRVIFSLSFVVAVLCSFWITDIYAQQELCLTSKWHPLACGHEHGDAPPQWIIDAGYELGFDTHGGFHGNTSAVENTAKHNAMKGFLGTWGTTEVYLRYHAASNPADRMSRYHSYEVFQRDKDGGVTHFQGWMNSGNPNSYLGKDGVSDSNSTPGRASRTVNDPGIRPVILVVDWDAIQAGINCEQWYVTTSRQGWGPDFGITICDNSALYFWGENWYNKQGRKYTDEDPGSPASDIFDKSNWFNLCDYGWSASLCVGVDRTIEYSWYGPGASNPATANRGNPPRGVTFYATQFGDIVNGPNAVECQGTTERFGTVYKNICLPQYIALTATAIDSGLFNNQRRKVYSHEGITVPN